jgi:hypothetical protein
LTYDFLDLNIVGCSPNSVHDSSGLDLFDSGTLTPPDEGMGGDTILEGTVRVRNEWGNDARVPFGVPRSATKRRVRRQNG